MNGLKKNNNEELKSREPFVFMICLLNSRAKAVRSGLIWVDFGQITNGSHDFNIPGIRSFSTVYVPIAMCYVLNEMCNNHKLFAFPASWKLNSPFTLILLLQIDGKFFNTSR